MRANHEFEFALIAIAAFMSGCAQDGTMTTGSVNAVPDPACVKLATQIRGLEEQGVTEKVSNAAKKKYKLNPSDLTKVAQLNKANATFQSRCSNMPPKPNLASVPANAAKKTNGTTKPKVAANKSPPIPVHKPSIAALGETDASAQAESTREQTQPPPQTGAAAIAPIMKGNPDAVSLSSQGETAVINRTPQDKPEEPQTTITTGTIPTAPFLQTKPAETQPTQQVGTPASGPTAPGTPEAVQLSPRTEAPTVLPPSQ